jgi:aryl-alcohol dehydrogenase-like predicted oxidoreductase
MSPRALGTDGLAVSEVSLGCWQLARGWGNPWKVHEHVRGPY